MANGPFGWIRSGTGSCRGHRRGFGKRKRFPPLNERGGVDTPLTERKMSDTPGIKNNKSGVLKSVLADLGGGDGNNELLTVLGASLAVTQKLSSEKSLVDKSIIKSATVLALERFRAGRLPDMKTAVKVVNHVTQAIHPKLMPLSLIHI